MKKIFFVPVADVSKDSKFYETAINGIIHKKNRKKVWGVINTNSAWDRVSEGDVIFVYNKGFLVFKAIIKSKFIDTQLSNKLWDSKKKIDGTILDYDKILEFSDITPCKMSFDIIKEMSNYREKSSVRKFMELSPIGYDNMVSKYKSVNSFINSEDILNKF